MSSISSCFPMIDDLWICAFLFLDVKEFAAISTISKRCHQLTNYQSNNHRIRRYWQCKCKSLCSILNIESNNYIAPNWRLLYQSLLTFGRVFDPNVIWKNDPVLLACEVDNLLVFQMLASSMTVGELTKGRSKTRLGVLGMCLGGYHGGRPRVGGAIAEFFLDPCHPCAEHLNVTDKGVHYTDDSPLTAACWHRDVASVELLLRHPRMTAEGVNTRDAQGYTPLGLACMRSDAPTPRQRRSDAIAKLLLEDPRTDVNCANGVGVTPLIDASRRGRAALVRLLLSDEKVDVNATSDSGDDALAVATRRQEWDVVKLLLRDQRTSLRVHLMKGTMNAMWLDADATVFAECLVLLLNRDDVDIKARDDDGQTVMAWAIKTHNVKVVDALTEKMKKKWKAEKAKKAGKKISLSMLGSRTKRSRGCKRRNIGTNV